MPPTAINVAAILVLILPGFLAYRFAVWRRVDPSNKSPLWQLSEIAEYSVYVHLIGVALVASVQFLLNRLFEVDTHLQELLQKGPNDFLKTYFSEAVLWFTLYPVYVIISSTILGVYDVPARVSSVIVSAVHHPSNWLSSNCKLLNWIPVPKNTRPQEPVWYYAFNIMSDGYTSKLPHALVTLKSGDVFYGEIASYPITLDNELNKDFLIKNARYYKGGDLNDEQKLYEVDSVGAVLLNSANADSIMLYYEDISEEGPS